MFVKTLLDDEAITYMSNQPESGTQFVELMHDRTVLLLNGNQEKLLAEALPTSVWTRLKEDLVKGRIRKRTWSGKIADEKPGPAPEVIVGDGVNPTMGTGDRSTVPGFGISPTVSRRTSLTKRERKLADREEFWNELLCPAIEAFPAKLGSVEIVDQYGFQDFRRQMEKSRTTADSGLGWTLERLDRLAAEGGQPLKVSIVTAEKPKHLVKNPKDDMSREIIVDLLNDLLGSIPCRHLDLKVLVVPRKIAATNPPGLHARRIIVKGICGFTLDRGLGDFWKNDDRSSTTWAWFPRWSDDENRFHQSLKSRIPKDFILSVE